MKILTKINLISCILLTIPHLANACPAHCGGRCHGEAACCTTTSNVGCACPQVNGRGSATWWTLDANINCRHKHANSRRPNHDQIIKEVDAAAGAAM